MKSLQLVLTNPCTKQWSEIERADGNHHCSSCNKNILDLSAKSDKELIQFFKNKNDNICGRVLASQLNRELVLPSPRLSWHWLVPFALGASIISQAQAQNLKPVVVPSEQHPKSLSLSVEEANNLPPLKTIIAGKVVDNLKGNPLNGVEIRIKGDEKVLAITDSNGRFELSLNDKDMLNKFIFNLPGFSKVETYINDKIVVKLIAERRIMLGGISTISLDQTPLYYVYAGKKGCILDALRMNELSPDWIEKIEILKDAKATAIYGARGANGVILIEIKKAYFKKIKFSQ
ncbi:carboxypeptidase-like regulatory domain-containing protein [Pedobacter jeongneungensis]|uniref:carboxypeptidase-like regulatory domain-containing protein n=1 Tax=Pedobacter jeongneungensis TaxID=947309 RepID=UPI00046A9642|nr:carboxypeptidase-like regulatory domain-containing protein [Pedobacter jeongneungensis]